MSEQQQKKKTWLSKIESREDALKIIKETSMGFFILAGLQAVLSFWLGFSILFDAVIYVVCGFFLRRHNSRAAAVALLLLSILGAGVTFANKAGANLGGGNNIFLALIILWAAIRAVESTFKLRGRFSVDTSASAVLRTDETLSAP